MTFHQATYQSKPLERLILVFRIIRLPVAEPNAHADSDRCKHDQRNDGVTAKDPAPHRRHLLPQHLVFVEKIPLLLAVVLIFLLGSTHVAGNVLSQSLSSLKL